MTILRMQEAYEGVIDHFDRQGRACYGVGIRSGALLDALGLLFGRWHFAPQDGASLLRELNRIKSVEIGTPLGASRYFEPGDEGVDLVPSVEIAGHVREIGNAACRGKGC